MSEIINDFYVGTTIMLTVLTTPIGDVVPADTQSLTFDGLYTGNSGQLTQVSISPTPTFARLADGTYITNLDTTGFVPGTYRWRVRAVDSLGRIGIREDVFVLSPLAGEVTAAPPPTTTPGAATLISVTAPVASNGVTHITYTWSPPTAPAPVVGDYLLYALPNGAQTATFSRVAASNTTATVIGVIANLPIDVWVVAQSTNGVSGPASNHLSISSLPI